MTAHRKRGLTILSKERNIIASVMTCVTRKLNRYILSVLFTKATAWAAKYCNISSRTMQLIRNGSKNFAAAGGLSI
jgi:hypothetical protein